MPMETPTNGLQQAGPASPCSPVESSRGSCLLSTTANSVQVFNFTFMDFDFCHPVICHRALSTPLLGRQLYKLLFKLHWAPVLGLDKYNRD